MRRLLDPVVHEWLDQPTVTRRLIRLPIPLDPTGQRPAPRLFIGSLAGRPEVSTAQRTSLAPAPCTAAASRDPATARRRLSRDRAAIGRTRDKSDTIRGAAQFTGSARRTACIPRPAESGPVMAHLSGGPSRQLQRGPSALSRRGGRPSAARRGPRSTPTGRDMVCRCFVRVSRPARPIMDGRAPPAEQSWPTAAAPYLGDL